MGWWPGSLPCHWWLQKTAHEGQISPTKFSITGTDCPGAWRSPARSFFHILFPQSPYLISLFMFIAASGVLRETPSRCLGGCLYNGGYGCVHKYALMTSPLAYTAARTADSSRPLHKYFMNAWHSKNLKKKIWQLASTWTESMPWNPISWKFVWKKKNNYVTLGDMLLWWKTAFEFHHSMARFGKNNHSQTMFPCAVEFIG